MQALTYPLPVTVIAEIIGIPAEDRARFKAWSRRGGREPRPRSSSAASTASASRGSASCSTRCAPTSCRSPRSARARPQEDLLTGLVQAEHEGSQLTPRRDAPDAGPAARRGQRDDHDADRQRRARAARAPGAGRARAARAGARLDAAIEEVLRYASPVQFDPRRATRSVELHGVEARARTTTCCAGSARRTATSRSSSARTSSTRRASANPHIAFGFGAALLPRREPRAARGARRARGAARAAPRAIELASRRGRAAAPPEPGVPRRHAAAGAVAPLSPRETEENDVSEHKATISWERGARDFTYETLLARSHLDASTAASRSPATAAPAYLGNPALVDPEEAFVAAVASCHMLTFLAIAARKRLVVERYEDAAVGLMEKNDAGKLAVTRVDAAAGDPVRRGEGALRRGARAAPRAGARELLHRELGAHRDHGRRAERREARPPSR